MRWISARRYKKIEDRRTIIVARTEKCKCERRIEHEVRRRQSKLSDSLRDWHKKESKAGTQVHGALKAACYDAFRAARQEMNTGVAGMEVQGGFDARAWGENQ